MSQQKHPIDIVAQQGASELTDGSPFMDGLKAMVWGNNAPLSQTTSKADAMDMFQAELSTPEGRVALVKKWGQQKASEIEQELIQAGRVPGQSIPPEVQPA